MVLRSILVFSVLTFPMTSQHISSQDQLPSSPLHLRTTFQFQLAVPLQQAAPLFGPEGERCWAGEHWNPQFVYPQPARDTEAAVFTVSHGGRDSVWVNTVFDTTAGRMQYVSFIPDVLVSTVDVTLIALHPAATRVEVTYTRTALSVAANGEVHSLAAKDQRSGPEWQQAIEHCLERRG